MSHQDPVLVDYSSHPQYTISHLNILQLVKNQKNPLDPQPVDPTPPSPHPMAEFCLYFFNYYMKREHLVLSNSIR